MTAGDPARPAAAASTAAQATVTAAPRQPVARTVSGYSIPGQGSSTLISIITGLQQQT